MMFHSPLRGLIQQLGDSSEDRRPVYSRCLKWAVLAWAARGNTPSEATKQLSVYSASTVQILNYEIELGTFNKDSVFASNLIAWVAYSSCSDEIDPRAHFKHSLGILYTLSDLSRNNSLDEELVIFGPFIIDCANAWSVRNGVVPCRRTTFRQRTLYFEQLRLNDNAGIWYTGVLEAANSTLGNLLEVSLNCVSQTIKKEINYDFTNSTIDNTLQYIRAELGNVDLHQALRTLNQSFQGWQTDHTTVEGQLITRIFHRLRCVLLLHSVLEAPSIQTGVLGPKAKYIAEKVIVFCRKQAIRRDGPIEDYFLISWHNYCHLLLGGMGLSHQESPERKYT